MIPRHVRKKLPKAKIISIEIGGYCFRPYWARFRCANFIRWQLGRICVQHRWPWKEESARKIYPYLFTSDNPEAGQ